MKSPLAITAAIFALAALGLGNLAWRQHQELLRLRVTALDSGERAALQKRVWEAEKRARDGEARALLAREEQPESGIANANPGDTQKTGKATAGKKGPSQLAILAFLSSPDTQLALANKFREQVDARYGPLLKSLNLTPEQQTRLRSLLIERQGAVIDVAAALLAAGEKPKGKDLQLLVTEAQGETDRKLQSALGVEVYAQFQAYENTQLFRGATTDLQRGLARVEAPLSDAQAEKFATGMSQLAQSSLSPAQQQALQAITRMDQSRETLKQVEQLYKDRQTPPKLAKPDKK
jgi:hypothetical protein